jgi:hypothetical protein
VTVVFIPVANPTHSGAPLSTSTIYIICASIAGSFLLCCVIYLWVTRCHRKPVYNPVSTEINDPRQILHSLTDTGPNHRRVYDVHDERFAVANQYPVYYTQSLPPYPTYYTQNDLRHDTLNTWDADDAYPHRMMYEV